MGFNTSSGGSMTTAFIDSTIFIGDGTVIENGIVVVEKDKR